MRIVRLSVSDTEKALEQIANYYRHSALYTYLSNQTDSYKWYKDEYRHDTELIISQGYSYSYKGNYLIALDMHQFEEEHPDEFRHYFGCIPGLISFIGKERNCALFVCAFGPKGEYIDSNGYALINEFVRCNNDKVIITDCMTDADVKTFGKCTKGRLMIIDGQEYFRWGSEV